MQPGNLLECVHLGTCGAEVLNLVLGYSNTKFSTITAVTPGYTHTQILKKVTRPRGLRTRPIRFGALFLGLTRGGFCSMIEFS
jgi:hypothetical protein